mgnify:CR=1 FL=1
MSISFTLRHNVYFLLKKDIHYVVLCSNMANYTIDQLSKITGFSKLLIRTWENRYHLFAPERTNTNIRMYNDASLVKALNVMTLREKGYKISKISVLSDSEIEELVKQVSIDDDVFHLKQLNKVIESALTFDKHLFNKTINDSLSKFDTLYVYRNIILPSLERIGFLWLTKEVLPSQEHFLSEMIKQKLYSKIDLQTKKRNQEEVWLLLLPEGEHHEIGLLVANLMLSEQKKFVIYLGQSVPLNSLNILNEYYDIDHVLIFAVTRSTMRHLDEIILNLKSTFKHSIINCVTSKVEHSFKADKKIHIINTIDQFQSIID